MRYQYQVISIHPWTGGCDINCPFCYKKHKNKKTTKSNKFWIDLVKYCKKLAPQIACGADGEPFMNIPFIRKLSDECKKQKVILNITTNGKILSKLSDKKLKEALKGITMVSISFDRYKYPAYKDLKKYHELVDRIHKLTKVQVGCNLLIDKEMFKQYGLPFLNLVSYMFDIIKIDRVFSLYPKNIEGPNILEYKEAYFYLTRQYPMFFVDDLTKMVISENKYSRWKNPCHFAKDLISINEKGEVMGCSFDSKPLLILKKPKDLFKAKHLNSSKRYQCPYLKR